MLDAETVGDRADGLAHEEKERVQRQRCRARLRRQFAGEYLQAAVDHVEPPAHENQAERLQLPFRPDGHRDELHADHGCTRDHHAVDAEFWQKPRHGQGVEQPADGEARDDDAGDRQRAFAEFEQEGRDERKQAEHAAAFDEHRPVANACVRVHENRAIALHEG